MRKENANDGSKPKISNNVELKIPTNMKWNVYIQAFFVHFQVQEFRRIQIVFAWLV